MVNIGMIWGLGLGLLFLLAIFIYVKKRIKKEVKVINVQRPKEEGAGIEPASSGVGATESGTEERVSGEEPDGEPEERGGVQTKSVETTEPDEPRIEQHIPAIPPPKPFKY